MKTILHSLLAYLACVTIVSAQAAGATAADVKSALDIAMKHKTIAAGGDKMKLYSGNGTINGDRTTWGFTFYDGGELLHSIYVDSKGKTRYSSRDKGTFSLFKDLDFTKVAKPADTIMPDIVAKATKVLNALELKPDSSGKMYLNYSLRNTYKDKATGIHFWSVSLPTGDGTSGKTVGFKNGAFDTIMNSSIKK